MLYEEKFIQERYNRYQLMKYLEHRLERAGLANVEIQRTPIMTRISLEVLNPARIIGRKGKLINELTDEIKRVFNLENPQISVIEVKEPFLEPRIVARKAARFIEMGKKVRAVLHYFLREILARGAMGAEIVAAGKIGAKGARGKKLRVSAGYIPTAGEPARLVKTAHLNANTKSGVIGVLVRIVTPGTVFPDKPVPEPEEKKEEKPKEESKEKKPAKQAAPEKPKESAKAEEKKPAAKKPAEKKKTKVKQKKTETKKEPAKETKKEEPKKKEKPKDEKKG